MPFVFLKILKRKLKVNKREGGLDTVTEIENVQTGDCVTITYHVTQDSIDNRMKEHAKAFFHGLEMGRKEI